jgi:aryl-alcohol dehydrogenase-like predicted oxidoreductase
MRKSFDYLGVTRLDLMQVHNLTDWRTQLETLTELRAAGTVRYIGVTHYTVSAHPALEEIVKNRLVDFVQLNYNIGVRDAEKRLLPQAADRGVAVIVNRPFEEGALFGRVRSASLPPWAADIGCTSFAQIFLTYILSNPAVTCAIPGTDKIDHLEDNMAAACGVLPDAAMRKRMADWFDAL